MYTFPFLYYITIPVQLVRDQFTSIFFYFKFLRKIRTYRLSFIYRQKPSWLSDIASGCKRDCCKFNSHSNNMKCFHSSHSGKKLKLSKILLNWGQSVITLDPLCSYCYIRDKALIAKTCIYSNRIPRDTNSYNNLA